jgi:hypothetical protein
MKLILGSLLKFVIIFQFWIKSDKHLYQDLLAFFALGRDWVVNRQVTLVTRVSSVTMLTWGLPAHEIPSQPCNHNWGILYDNIIT